ncbi:MAG: YIP1 family protein, partial [Candidatus Desulforudis sp.]|nr:YIP1 family protein [Desulforudis sp.]
MLNEAGDETVIQEERRLSTVQRLMGVVFSPGETFRDIVARPYSLAAALVAVAVSLVATVLILPKLQVFTAWQFKQMPAGMMSPEELAAIQEYGAMAVAGGAIAVAIVGPVLIWLVCGLVLKLYNMFAGNQTSFRQFFAVAVYAYVPVLLGGLVYAVMIMFSRAENLPYVTTSLAALFPGMEYGFTYALLAQVNPFTLWAIALVGMGGAQAMQVSSRSTIGYLLALWVLYAVVAAWYG